MTLLQIPLTGCPKAERRFTCREGMRFNAAPAELERFLPVLPFHLFPTLSTPTQVMGQSALHFNFFWIHLDAWQVATAMLQYGYGKQLPEKAKGLRFCRLREHCHSWCWLKRSRKCHGKPCSYCILPGKVKKPDFNAYLVICTQPWQRIYKQSMWKTLPYKWLHVPCKTIGDPLILRTFLGEPQILTAPYFVYLDLHPSSNSIVEMKRGQFQYTVSFSSFVLFGSCNYLQCMKSWKEYCERCLVRRESGDLWAHPALVILDCKMWIPVNTRGAREPLLVSVLNTLEMRTYHTFAAVHISVSDCTQQNTNVMIHDDSKSYDSKHAKFC